MVTRLRSPHDELEGLHEKNTRELQRHLSLVQRARITGDINLMDRRIERLGTRLGSMLAAADLLGRRRLLLELRASGLMEAEAEVTGAIFAAQHECNNRCIRPESGCPEVSIFAATPIVAPVEGIAEILRRHPVLAEGWEATAAAWQAQGFALARSANLTVTKNVQDAIVRFLRGGLDIGQAQSTIRRQLATGGTPFTKAYADTVFRTLTSSAYQAGRAAQAAKPSVQRVASGWRYQATLDSDVRPTHKAGDEFVAHTQDPVWAVHAPPNGFNCRCAVELVPTALMVELGLSHEDGSLRQLQRAPAGFVPDRGFTKSLRI